MLIRHTYVNVVSNVVGAAVGFAGSILIVRVYGVEVVGKIAYMTGLVGLLRFVVDLGIDQAGLKYMAEKEEDYAPEFTAYLSIKIGLLLLFLLMAAVFLFHVFKPEDPLLYVIVTANIFWLSFADVFVNLLTARRAFVPLGFRRIASRVVMLGFTVLFCTAVQNWYYIALLPSLECFFMILFFVPYMTGTMKIRLGLPDRGLLKKHCKYALPLSLSEGIGLSLSNVDKVFVGHLLSDAHVGYLAVAERVYGGFLVIVKAVTQQLLPEITYRLANLKEEVFHRQMEKIVRMTSVLGTFLALTVLAYADVLVYTMYGPGLETASFILRVFSLEILVKLFFRPYHSLVYATERHRIFLWLTIPNQAIRTFLTYFLIPFQVAGLTIGGAAKPLAIAIVWVAPRGVTVLHTVKKTFNTLFLSRNKIIYGVFLGLGAAALAMDHWIANRPAMAFVGAAVLGLHVLLLRRLGVIENEVFQDLTRPLLEAIEVLKRKKGLKTGDSL